MSKWNACYRDQCKLCSIQDYFHSTKVQLHKIIKIFVSGCNNKALSKHNSYCSASSDSKDAFACITVILYIHHMVSLCSGLALTVDEHAQLL